MGSCASISLPSTKQTEKYSLSSDRFDCAIYSTQGRRSRMEDRHIACLSLPKHPQYSLFGVFDGFNGDDASSYLSQNIVDALDIITNLEDNDAIIQAIEQLDVKYIHPQKTHEKNQNVYNPAAGCTFVLVLVHTIGTDHASIPMPFSDRRSKSFKCLSPDVVSREWEPLNSVSVENECKSSFAVENEYRVRVFWAGDSRAVLMSDCSKFRNLTEDHHCSSPHEAERITNTQGAIINDRIGGIYKFSRCFGCHPMKRNASLAINEQKIISEADCTSLLCKKKDQVFIFSDGLTEKWSDSQFNTRCKHHVLRHEDEKEGNLSAMQYLCEQAIDEGSRDNITALSVQFK